MTCGCRAAIECHAPAAMISRGAATTIAPVPRPATGGRRFNASTVFNAAPMPGSIGAATSAPSTEQNEAVLLDPRLMNATWPELLAKLRADRGYRAAVQGALRRPTEREHVLDAWRLSRSLLTPDARFDRYLRGERDAITAEEARGYQLFKAYGCIACHQGVNIGGNLFQSSVFSRSVRGARQCRRGRPWPLHHHRQGGDRNVFRVPILRNVAVTSPTSTTAARPRSRRRSTSWPAASWGGSCRGRISTSSSGSCAR